MEALVDFSVKKGCPKSKSMASDPSALTAKGSIVPASSPSEPRPSHTYLSVADQHILSVLLVMRRQLDQLALSSLLSQTPGVELVGAESTLTDAVDLCRAVGPAAVIIDASFPDSSAFKVAHWLVDDGRIERVAFLDDRLTILRAQQALSIPGACYFTRDERIEAVCDHLRGSSHANITSSELWLTPSSSSLISDSSTLSHFDKYGILTLTAKERRIMKLLAQGYQVKEIAQAIEISESTVDNHKSRIMRKLRVHRATLLARVAVETGLVDQ